MRNDRLILLILRSLEYLSGGCFLWVIFFSLLKISLFLIFRKIRVLRLVCCRPLVGLPCFRSFFIFISRILCIISMMESYTGCSILSTIDIICKLNSVYLLKIQSLLRFSNLSLVLLRIIILCFSLTCLHIEVICLNIGTVYRIWILILYNHSFEVEILSLLHSYFIYLTFLSLPIWENSSCGKLGNKVTSWYLSKIRSLN